MFETCFYPGLDYIHPPAVQYIRVGGANEGYYLASPSNCVMLIPINYEDFERYYHD